MRAKDIELAPIELKDGERSHVACGWPGCRNPDGAVTFAKFKIRTGRTHAGLWSPRIMPLCEPHKGDFKVKYMSGLCPKCNKSPVDENSKVQLCEDCQREAS